MFSSLVIAEHSQTMKGCNDLNDEYTSMQTREQDLMKIIATFSKSSKRMDEVLKIQRDISDKSGVGFEHLFLSLELMS